MGYAKQIVRFFYDPVGVVADLRTSRPVLAAFVAAFLGSFAYALVLRGFPRDLVEIVRLGAWDSGAGFILMRHVFRLRATIVPMIFLTGIYIPVSLLILGALSPGERGRDLVRREYTATLAAALTAWASVFLAWSVVALVLADPDVPRSVAVWSVLPGLAFLVPFAVCLAAIPTAGYARAIAAALLATPAVALMPVAAWASVMASSPVILVILFFIFRGVWRDWSATRDARARYEQNLKAATLNPADSDAHLNLGIILEERGDVDGAVAHFTRAIEIDDRETDAHFRLGRIARKRGNLAAAISHFENVVRLDEDHAQFEIWREIGATYLAAGQYDDARSAFERFLDRRPSDAEGQYLLGLTLAKLNLPEEATAQMRAVVETVRGAPAFKYRLEQRWLRDAEEFLRQK